MTTTSSNRHRTSSVAAAKRTATNSVSAQGAVLLTGSQGVQMYQERCREIGKAIHEAAVKLSDVDWSRESPAISEAENHLNETMTLYCENKVSMSDVKASYKNWVKAHKGGMF